MVWCQLTSRSSSKTYKAPLSLPASHFFPKMTEATKRRRPRAHGVLLAIILACTPHGASAFVAPSALSLSPASSANPGRPSWQQQQRRQQQHSFQQQQQGSEAQLSSRARFAEASRGCSSLNGMLAVDSDVSTDNTDGWNPIEGVEIGTCSLVGSGPGDPDLLTVAGLRELQSADMVIADRLVSAEILGLVRKS